MCQEADDVLLLPFTPVDLDTRIRLAMKRRFMKNAGRSGPRRGGMFAGRYKVDREIYCGSYSSVYLAFDISVGGHSDPVALKIYSPSPVQTRSGKFISLFLHETHRHFHLNHPKITRLLDFGQTNGLYFLVTEYVPGESLADILATRGALEQSALIRIGVDIAEVLIHLQHKGLIHRDVKPDNIIVTPEGDARLIDFGLARSQDDLPAAPHDTIDGTPMYVAPELILDAAVADSPADVYALGITLFHAATGRFPFADTDDSDRAERGLTDIPLSLRDAAPGVEPALSQLVDRMLASQPGRRPTPEQLRNALLRLME
jgi:serine/threonine-protein kinase